MNSLYNISCLNAQPVLFRCTVYTISMHSLYSISYLDAQPVQYQDLDAQPIQYQQLSQYTAYTVSAILMHSLYNVRNSLNTHAAYTISATILMHSLYYLDAQPIQYQQLS